MEHKITITEVPVGNLKPSPHNPNSVPPDNQAKLEKSIERFGFVRPVLARTLDNGTMEIVGGEHRVIAAKKLGYKTVPVVNLGRISDERAKELLLVDNGRYGADDSIQLAALLEGLGDISELTTFMPYTDADFDKVFSSISIDLDALDIDESEDMYVEPKAMSAPQTHTLLRFKVPIEDAESITKIIEKIMKNQKFTQEDSLSNAGNALVFLVNTIPS